MPNGKLEAYIRMPNGKQKAQIRMPNGKREAHIRMQIAIGKLIYESKLYEGSSYPPAKWEAGAPGHVNNSQVFVMSCCP
jgi:hypothetical protein